MFTEEPNEKEFSTIEIEKIAILENSNFIYWMLGLLELFHNDLQLV
jgi:hypothetical protein